jgi:hypothetical protein
MRRLIQWPYALGTWAPKTTMATLILLLGIPIWLLPTTLGASGEVDRSRPIQRLASLYDQTVGSDVVQEGREWVDVGTAWADHEDMQGAASNLDELASTRATNRALRLATGAGLASIEELDGGEVVRDADGPAPPGSDAPREELTTDGGRPASVTCPRGRVRE